MNRQVFTREYLQKKPEERKQQHIEAIIQGYIHQLLQEASHGKTLFMIPLKSDIDQRRNHLAVGAMLSHPPPPEITNDDIIASLKLKFPDCKVEYKEEWVEVNSNTKNLKKGIMIDWS